MCAKCWVTHAASFSHAIGVATDAGTRCTTTWTVSGSPGPELGAVALSAALPLGDSVFHVVGTVMAIAFFESCTVRIGIAAARTVHTVVAIPSMHAISRSRVPRASARCIPHLPP